MCLKSGLRRANYWKELQPIIFCSFILIIITIFPFATATFWWTYVKSVTQQEPIAIVYCFLPLNKRYHCNTGMIHRTIFGLDRLSQCAKLTFLFGESLNESFYCRQDWAHVFRYYYVELFEFFLYYDQTSHRPRLLPQCGRFFTVSVENMMPFIQFSLFIFENLSIYRVSDGIP